MAKLTSIHQGSCALSISRIHVDLSGLEQALDNDVFAQVAGQTEGCDAFDLILRGVQC